MAQSFQDRDEESDDDYDESEDPGSDCQDSSDDSEPEVTEEIMGKDIPVPDVKSGEVTGVPCEKPCPPSPGSTPILTLVPAAHSSEETHLRVGLRKSGNQNNAYKCSMIHIWGSC